MVWCDNFQDYDLPFQAERMAMEINGVESAYCQLVIVQATCVWTFFYDIIYHRKSDIKCMQFQINGMETSFVHECDRTRFQFFWWNYSCEKIIQGILSIFYALNTFIHLYKKQNVHTVLHNSMLVNCML